MKNLFECIAIMFLVVAAGSSDIVTGAMLLSLSGAFVLLSKIAPTKKVRASPLIKETKNETQLIITSLNQKVKEIKNEG